MFSQIIAGLKNVVSVGKKILLVLVAYFIVISLFTYFSSEKKPTNNFNPVNKTREDIYKVINDQEMKKTKEGRITIAFYRLMMCGMIGEGCTNNPTDGDKNFNTSIFGFATNLLVLPYASPPASGVYWAANSLSQAGFIPKIYAAEGIGFSSIKGFASIWSLFRNLTFLILVIVIIALGFMIMFRMKLNPQTVISIENSLPRIVITLLLITFSFAIAGFLIDLMYVIIGISISTLTKVNPPLGDLNPGNMQNLQNKYFGAGVGDLWPYGADINIFSAGNALFNVMPLPIQLAFKGTIGWVVALASIKFFNSMTYQSFLDSLNGISVEAATFGLGIGSLPHWVVIFIDLILFMFLLPFIPGILIGLILLFTLLFLIFRIFFLLLTSYIKIILFIVLAPIILLAEAIPGRNAFGFWFKTLFVELLSFPIVVIIALIGYAIISVNNVARQSFTLPFLGGYSSQDLGALIGIGIVIVIPDILKMVKGLFGVKELPVSVGLGTFFGGATTVVGGGLGIIGQYGSLSLAIPGLRRWATKILPGSLGEAFKQGDDIGSSSGGGGGGGR